MLYEACTVSGKHCMNPGNISNSKLLFCVQSGEATYPRNNELLLQLADKCA